GDAECLALQMNTLNHHATSECECTACLKTELQEGCMNTHSCFSKVKALLDTLPPKWDPRVVVEDQQPPVEPDEEWSSF
ncbi:hypothetical protein L208DRAFT_1226659, partial [Tricholoma matsutake]